MIVKWILALLAGLQAWSMNVSIPAPESIKTEVSQLVETALHETERFEALKQELLQYTEKNLPKDEVWSISLILPKTDLRLDISAEPQTAASTVKLFLTGAVMAHWDELDVSTEDLNHLLESALIISDNEAASVLISLLGKGDTTRGKEIVNEFCREHGYFDTTLGILFSGLDDTGTYNVTTAQDTALYLEDLLDGKIPRSQQLLDMMKRSERLAKIPYALPEGTTTANKTGELYETENDACIVFGPRQTYILSIMADETTSEAAIRRIREISKLVWYYLETDSTDPADVTVPVKESDKVQEEPAVEEEFFDYED